MTRSPGETIPDKDSPLRGHAERRDLTAEGLAKVIIGCVVHHYDGPDCLVTDPGFLFTSSLSYFLNIK